MPSGGRTTNIPDKSPAEAIRAPFDFTSTLDAGDSVTAATVTAAVYSGTDASPSSLISGAVTLASPLVYQKIVGGLAGVIYNLTCTATTANGFTRVQEGFLSVTDAGAAP